MSRVVVPLQRRKLDILLLGFFAVNLFFITYCFDIEQLVIADPEHFAYPLWPPKGVIDAAHWWGHTFDPLLMARPPWFRATIWLDQLLFGPFYTAALWAFWKGREWIRPMAFCWAGLMFANVSIILFEEMVGPHATPNPLAVIGANGPWLLLPIVVAARLWRSEHPFTEESK
jgi:hypothetical protein